MFYFTFFGLFHCRIDFADKILSFPVNCFMVKNLFISCYDNKKNLLQWSYDGLGPIRGSRSPVTDSNRGSHRNYSFKRATGAIFFFYSFRNSEKSNLLFCQKTSDSHEKPKSEFPTLNKTLLLSGMRNNLWYKQL